MSSSSIDPSLLVDRSIGPVTILFGLDNGKYPHGNSFVINGSERTAIVDPCLGVVARKNRLPQVDLVLHSHAHEDHIAGTHLFPDVPWLVHEADALGLESIEGVMEIYGLTGQAHDDFRRVVEEDFFYPHGGSVETFLDGQVLDFGGVTLTVVHTPGHTRGHSAFLVEWGDAIDEKFVYLGDIELTGFGPYYGDAWSNLTDFESSLEKLQHIDANFWLTFHHKGLIESRARFLEMLGDFTSVIDRRESNLLTFIETPRTMDEIVQHRFVYRPGQTGIMVDAIERRSMGMHLERLVERSQVIEENGTYRVNFHSGR